MVRRDTDLQNSLETFLQNRSRFFFLNIAYPFRESVARSLQETDSLSPVDAERFMWDRRHRSEIHQCEIVLPPPPIVPVEFIPIVLPPTHCSSCIHTNRSAPHPLLLYSYQSFCPTPIVPVVFIPIVLHHTHCSVVFIPIVLHHTHCSVVFIPIVLPHTHCSSCIHTNRSAPHRLFQLYSYQSFCTTRIVQLYSYQSFCPTPIVPVVFIPIVLPHTDCSSCIHTNRSAPHALFSCIHTNRSAPHPLFQLYSYQVVPLIVHVLEYVVFFLNFSRCAFHNPLSCINCWLVVNSPAVSEVLR